MAGTCKYCGFSGTNDQMERHASECPHLDFYDNINITETCNHFKQFYSKMRILKDFIVDVIPKNDKFYAIDPKNLNGEILIPTYILDELMSYIYKNEKVYLGFIPLNDIWFIVCNKNLVWSSSEIDFKSLKDHKIKDHNFNRYTALKRNNGTNS